MGLAWKSDGHESMEDNDHPGVDVSDVAEALLLAYEKQKQKEDMFAYHTRLELMH